MSDPNTDNYVFDSFDLSDPNLQGWDGQGGGPPDIAQGEHLFEFTSIAVKNTKAGDGKNFECELKVVGGEADGKITKTWYHFASDKGLKDGSKKRIAHVFRDVLNVMNPQGGFETKDVVGRRMYATVAHEERTQYDAQTQQNKTYVNLSISCERRAEDDQQPAASQSAAAPLKAASAPPSRPPAAGARPPGPPARPPGPPARPAR